MKATFDFNPQRDYGPATASIREIVGTWRGVDWFAPPPLVQNDEGVGGAVDDVVRHTLLGRTHAPNNFAADLAVRVVHGDWRDFVTLCDTPQRDVSLGAGGRARPEPLVPVLAVDATWDWKYGALKQLCHEHSVARGWRLDKDGKDLAASTNDGLFVSFGSHVAWSFPPALDAKAAVARAPIACGAADVARSVEAVGWYHSYANMDATHAIEWQLASRGAPLDDNPFFPLLRVYARGFLPFSFCRDEIVLFAFAPPSQN